ncbi:hypothetical protein POTOM_004230 [Populus tomentosa]|uniref:ORMDL family protein n=1 Tax=Populus tomentosa TaxID=118781 RepID=A0A8X8AJH5_POPTO|nr:hypothetical protein POTOM_004230 [Populus tomentosa]
MGSFNVDVVNYISYALIFAPVSDLTFKNRSERDPFSHTLDKHWWYAWITGLTCVLLVTYHFFHWKKGTPFADDQGIYNGLTWWEQIENGKQLTRNRKFLTVVPVVLRLMIGELWYLMASHTTDYQNPMLFFNTLAVFVLVVAKFPHMHKVRIFGINADH